MRRPPVVAESATEPTYSEAPSGAKAKAASPAPVTPGRAVSIAAPTPGSVGLKKRPAAAQGLLLFAGQPLYTSAGAPPKLVVMPQAQYQFVVVNVVVVTPPHTASYHTPRPSV